MLFELKGNMFWEAPMGALVGIPVNTVGVAGRGLALLMKQRYPEAHDKYKAACRKGTINVGEMLVVDAVEFKLAMIPTKYAWQHPSVPELIDESVQRLLEYMQKHKIEEAYVPRLGCGVGTGMLDYETEVRPILAHYFGNEEQKEALYVYNWV